MVFRDLIRKKQALSENECIRILTEEKRGVLAVLGDGGYPYAMPMNHWYDPEDGHIYFHGGKHGHKIDALQACDKVSFCVYDGGTHENGQWYLDIRSVIVFGRMRAVTDKDRAMDICRALSHKFTADETYIENEVKDSGPGTLVLELIPEHMTGKLVHER